MGEALIKDIMLVLMNFLQDYFQPFTNSFQPLLFVILTLYIMYVAYKLMYGDSTDAKGLLTSLLIATVVTSIYGTYSMYKYWIIDPTLSISLGSASFFLGSNGGGTFALFSALDEAFAMLFLKMDMLLEATSWTDVVSNYAMIAAISLAYSILYGYFLLLMVGSLFALVVLFVLGGIPLGLAIVPSTRFVFWAWVRTIANYALIPVVASIVMAISLQFLDDMIFDFSSVNPDDLGLFSHSTGLILLGAAISFYFLLKSTEIVGMLTGGQPSNMGALAQTMGGVAGAASKSLIVNKGTKAAGAWGAGGAMRLGAFAYEKMKGYR